MKKKTYSGMVVVGKKGRIIAMTFVEPKDHPALVQLGFTQKEAKETRNEKIVRFDFTIE